MRVLIAGGGSGGHVVPALAVSVELRRRGAEVQFVGSRRPDDRELAEAAGFPFESISTGKLRRYVSLTTLLEPFRVYAGYRQSLGIIKRFRPDVVFAKGGFAAVPVIRAAHRLKVPIVLHESDLVPGLANRIGARYAAALAVSFPAEQMPWRAKCPVVYTGNPLRKGVVSGQAARATKRFGLEPRVPLVLVLGGSQGALPLNKLVQEGLPELLTEAQVVHQVGKRWMAAADEAATVLPPKLAGRYHPQGFFGDELFDLLAAADVVVSRAGAGGLAEIAATGKPSILVPLPAAASDHQRANAAVFERAKAALVLEEAKITSDELVRTVKRLLHDPTRRSRMVRAAKSLAKPDAARDVAALVWRVGKEGHA